MSNKLKNFLKKYEASKDAQLTHVSLFHDTDAGRYEIPKNQMENLWKIFAEHVFEKNKDTFLAEKHPEKYSKIFIDIDLRYSEGTERKYSFELIKDLVKTYQDGLQMLMSETLTQEEALAYVIEKESAEYDDEKNILKDGIHIMFPFLCISYDAQHWLRRYVIEKIRNHPNFIECCNPIEEIIDESVVERNAVLMYGSKKKVGAQRYYLTYIFDLEGDEAEIPDDSANLLKILSLQQRSYEKPTLVKQLLEEEQKIEEVKVKHQNLEKELLEHTEEERPVKSREYIETLLGLLNSGRVNDYNFWLLIGAIIHNESEDYFDLWKEWSSQSPKYNEKHCDKLWNKTFSNYPEEKRVRIGTLVKMAMEDNPARYFLETERFSEEDDLTNAINNALHKTHADIAGLVYYLLKDKYRYSNEMWYVFENGRWRSQKSPLLLAKDISQNVRGTLLRYSAVISTKIADAQFKTGKAPMKGDSLEVTKKACDNVIDYLKNHNNKNSVINESKELFLDENFYKDLDLNEYLLGFDNGVMDLKTGEFRKSLPDDKISYSVGFDYSGEINMNIRNEILELFKKCLPDESVREFLLMFLASTLMGINKNQFFVNLEGTGGNGKSLIAGFHGDCLGDYADVLSSSYITNVSTSKEEHNSRLISVIKKRYVQIDEPEKGKDLNVAFVKQLTGTDKVQVRKAHAPDPEISIIPMFKLVLLCNKMPKVDDAQTDGLARRFKGVNFPSKFVNRAPVKPNEFAADPLLKKKLDEVNYKQQYILMLLEYLRHYIDNGEKIETPAAVDARSKEILKAYDTYKEFVEEELELTGNQTDVITTKELHACYKNYFKEYGGTGRYPNESLTEFKERITRTFDTYVVQVTFSKNIRNSGIRIGEGFIGVKMKEEDDDSD